MDYDTIKRFMNSDCPTEPLSPQEERKMIRLYKKTGDETARRRLIESNIRFVVKVAMRFRQQGLGLADLVQEGILGLIDAVEKFDVSRECRLITYASWWIRLYMQRALEQKSRPVNLPINKLEMLRKVRAFEQVFLTSNGRKPYDEEIAKQLDVDLKKVEQIADYAPSFQTLHARDDEHPGLERVLIDEDHPDPRETLWGREAENRLNEAMNLLTDRERDVLTHRFNLKGNGKKMSLRKVGQQMGLSAEGVRRIEEQAMDKLRRPRIRARMEMLFAN
ncbi:MAG: sigma-70 family RNA polymerase sigma factor [Candidatus Hinthialibacter antarcticus]|nr:sigma-70 family RNA polymerase sigma factor [Candidatus Hinthialibacter antarcticus]